MIDWLDWIIWLPIRIDLINWLIDWFGFGFWNSFGIWFWIGWIRLPFSSARRQVIWLAVLFAGFIAWRLAQLVLIFDWVLFDYWIDWFWRIYLFGDWLVFGVLDLDLEFISFIVLNWLLILLYIIWIIELLNYWINWRNWLIDWIIVLNYYWIIIDIDSNWTGSSSGSSSLVLELANW